MMNSLRWLAGAFLFSFALLSGPLIALAQYGNGDTAGDMSFDPPSAAARAAGTNGTSMAGQPRNPPLGGMPATPVIADPDLSGGEEKLPAVAASPRIDVLEIKDMDINDVFKLLSAKTGLNIIAGRSVQGRVTIFLKDVDVHDALAIILKSNGLAYEKQRGMIEIMTSDEYQQKYGLRFGVDVVTEVLDLSYGKAEEIVRTIPPLLTRDVGHVEFDATFNRIIITDIKPKIEDIKRLVKTMDRKQKEVLVEAKIIQVVLNDEFKMGINWNVLLSNEGKGKFQFGGDYSLTGIPKATIGTLTGKDFTAVLNMIESMSKTTILSNPRIAAVNNQEAKILVGSTQPYITSSFTTPSTGPTTTAETVNFIDVGVQLNVTPNIHEDGYVTMKIRPEISSVTGWTKTAKSDDKGIPIVEKSTVETVIRVKDGVTIIIAGLIKDDATDSKEKIPVLGNMPLLGKFFRRDIRTKVKSEIVIFLTPHIITGDVQTDPDRYFLLKGSKAY